MWRTWLVMWSIGIILMLVAACATPERVGTTITPVTLTTASTQPTLDNSVTVKKCPDGTTAGKEELPPPPGIVVGPFDPSQAKPALPPSEWGCTIEHPAETP